MENQKPFKKSVSSILITKLSSIHIHHPDLKNLVWGINPVQVTLCAFIDGAADVISFELFGVYCTMMTGNFIKLAISLGTHNYSDAYFSVVVIITYVTGCFLSLIVMDIFKADRRKSFLVCLPFQVIGTESHNWLTADNKLIAIFRVLFYFLIRFTLRRSH